MMLFVTFRDFKMKISMGIGSWLMPLFINDENHKVWLIQVKKK